MEVKAEVLVTTKLLDEEYPAGALLTQEELDLIPPSPKAALISQGIIALRDGPNAKPSRPMTPAERQANQALADATQAVEEREREVAEIRKKASEATAKAEAKAKERKPYALAAARGDAEAKKKAETLRNEQATLEIEARDLVDAADQAEAELEKAKESLEAAKRARIRIEAEGIAADRVRAAKEIETSLVTLNEKVVAYRQAGYRLNRLLGYTGGQIISQWRLESAINARLGLAVVEPAMLIDNLAKAEKQVLKNVINREIG